MVDYEIAYVANEQLKFFMVADRFMHNAGEIDWYDRLYQELDERLAQVLVDVEKESDEFALEYAKSIMMMIYIILLVLETNGVQHILMLCVIGKNNIGSKQNLLLHQNFSMEC